MRVLATGGAGYIGSHTVVEMLKAGHEVVIIDNLANAKREVVSRIADVTGRSPEFHAEDLRDAEAVNALFRHYDFDAVVHFAGLKSVSESVELPIEYYENNIGGTLNLCRAMRDRGVRNLVFSSSCTVYGTPASVPIDESFPTGEATNPYGRTKYMIEQILRDLHVADASWNIALLRYFNPIGAHASGRLGEDPDGIPNNLVPFLAQVAVGKHAKLRVFGNDYPTRDGTCIRDYIHVVDLALGHLKALDKLDAKPGVVTYNLGTGNGYTVLEVLQAFSKASGKELPHEIVARRAGDIPETWADATKAGRELGWTAERGIDEMCADSWAWQSANPNGYD